MSFVDAEKLKKENKKAFEYFLKISQRMENIKEWKFSIEKCGYFNNHESHFGPNFIAFSCIKFESFHSWQGILKYFAVVQKENERELFWAKYVSFFCSTIRKKVSLGVFGNQWLVTDSGVQHTNCLKLSSTTC